MRRLATKVTVTLSILRDEPIATKSSFRHSGWVRRSVAAAIAACSAPYIPNEATTGCAELQRFVAARTATTQVSKTKCRP
jgi:hypothetical protein